MRCQIWPKSLTLTLPFVLLAGCGTKVDPATSRITIKHAIDPGAKNINTQPQPTTVEDLAATKMPADTQGNLEDYQNRRVGPFENQVWSVNAKITSIQLRKDHDYYMEIQGQNGGHSVVEVPDPTLCKGSPLEPEISSLRKELEDKYHPSSTKQSVDDEAKIEGVGFLGWRGRPTGGRIMPGTSIQFGQGGSQGNAKGKA